MKTWNIDQAHSVIGFKVKHLMVSTVRGVFTDFSGTITTPDETSFNDAQIAFTAQANSITTYSEARDAHLKSVDFFNVEEFPTLSFTSTKTSLSDNTLTVTGDFTMHGVTKELTFTAEYGGTGMGLYGKNVAGFTLAGSLSRQDFGLTWNAALETGGVAVSDEVTFDIHIEVTEA